MSRIFIAFLGIFIMFMSYGVYNQINKQGIKSKRLPCQEKTITFERANRKTELTQARTLLFSSNLSLSYKIDYSKYMKSNLVNFINEAKLNKLMLDSLNKFIKSSSKDDETLLLDVYLYENDKQDKGKKGKKSKLYAGYIVLDFKLSNESVYKIQTDYMKDDASDLKERIQCALKSFVSF